MLTNYAGQQKQGYTFTTVGKAVGLAATTVPANAADQVRGKVVLVAVAAADGPERDAPGTAIGGVLRDRGRVVRGRR